MGPKGRFRNQLINKLSRERRTVDDTSVSPVIRQTLQHWGYKLTLRDANKHLKSKDMRLISGRDGDDRSGGDDDDDDDDGSS